MRGFFSEFAAFSQSTQDLERTFTTVHFGLYLCSIFHLLNYIVRDKKMETFSLEVTALYETIHSIHVPRKFMNKIM
jgi:hypothetical protein